MNLLKSIPGTGVLLLLSLPIGADLPVSSLPENTPSTDSMRVPVLCASPAHTPPPINGKLTEWSRTDSIEIDPYTTWRGRTDNRTVVRCMWDYRKLYIAFAVRDTRLNAQYLENNSRVWTDDCVEVYLSVNPPLLEIEINKINNLHHKTIE